ncbi:hypothetical protein PMAYCL1PPCAC_06107, partial [Pristionchus mayeri]
WSLFMVLLAFDRVVPPVLSVILPIGRTSVENNVFFICRRKSRLQEKITNPSMPWTRHQEMEVSRNASHLFLA